ncbi:ComEA family DNA-binding protein [Flagellimonas allohymeniacidonis]|uniref:Helix-hairpin-helix domain-containing protein n=1 Tax=Flagellimonas allohymeniacidonis TaxID=2517819 RepID=A0A4Q8QF55_9FLAO|nr:helix-hairpin-helix domain-containing protein [Allomuricauda hymeniacidonis]TAI46716.1 helix-hairpin-helix domain-containing protein [Allomuricauda hymeniacidonis]
MKKLKSHFKFNRQERSGIFFLLLLIIFLQGVYFFVLSNGDSNENLAFLDVDHQQRIDSLKTTLITKESTRTFTFNPNFISDYKGYVLGMSPAEIDRLMAFRKKGNFVNSPQEFQEVTRISDSLLQVMAPNFKFPDWKKTSRKTDTNNSYSRKYQNEKTVVIKDLNNATAEELRQISGIGEKLSGRIIKFRDRLGGFLVNDQLHDVYGLDAEVVERALLRFQVLKPPKIEKIEINKASVAELAQLVYIDRSTADKIVHYRMENGPIRSLNELVEVFNVSKEKIDRIGLYLSFEEE